MFIFTQGRYGDRKLWIAQLHRKANDTNPKCISHLKPHPNQGEMLYEAYLVLLHHKNIVHKQIQLAISPKNYP